MVSIVVPVYNVEKYLDKCIQSLLNQTYANLEIILVDDGSTDNSSTICDSYKQKEERIVVIHKENGGVSSARNEGLKVANGKYIAFVDSDDFVHNEYISRLVEGIGLGADLSICTMNETTIREIEDFSIEDAQYKLLSKEECFHEMLHSEKVEGFLSNKLFIKDRIAHSFKEDVYYSEDFVFCAQYAENVKKVAYIDLPLYFYWKNIDSVTNMHGVYNDKIFSLLEAEKCLREIYLNNYPIELDAITLNLLKVALNLRARYKYNKCDNVDQYQEIKNIIAQYYSSIKRSKKIKFSEKLNVFMTKNFPVLLLKFKARMLGRKLKK